MSFMSSNSLFDSVEDTTVTPRSKVTVDVILMKRTDHEFTVRTDETSRPVILPRYGVKILQDKPKIGDVITLRLTEKKAVDYNLV